MPQPTLLVKDANGIDRTINTVNPNGRAAAAESQPTTLSTEDKAALDNLLAKLPTLLDVRSGVEPLGAVGVARTLAAGAATAAQALTTTCTRVSLLALTNDLCFSADGTAATTSSHYLQAGERIDIRVATNTTINAIRAGAADAVLRITELV